MWHSIDNKPTKEGIIVVARFDGDKMVEFCDDWALLGDYFGPNKASYWGTRNITHWMYYSEYRELLEQLPRDLSHK